MSDHKFRFWSRTYHVAAVNTAVDFWLFIILREKHIIMWSWWWLVALMVGGGINMYTAYNKIEHIID